MSVTVLFAHVDEIVVFVVTGLPAGGAYVPLPLRGILYPMNMTLDVLVRATASAIAFAIGVNYKRVLFLAGYGLGRCWRGYRSRIRRNPSKLIG
jgi:hypothetical protein